eukprot:1619274-Amphidinium_carterae.3
MNGAIAIQSDEGELAHTHTPREKGEAWIQHLARVVQAKRCPPEEDWANDWSWSESIYPATTQMLDLEGTDDAVDKALKQSPKKASRDLVHPSAWQVNEAGVGEAARGWCRRSTVTGQAPRSVMGSRLYVLKKKRL